MVLQREWLQHDVELDNLFGFQKWPVGPADEYDR
jgi:hypothetical protein